MSITYILCQLVVCSEFLLSIDHGLDTVVHVLDEVDFGATKSAQV